jgi:negative regulator of flagellin synthesis FlgM
VKINDPIKKATTPGVATATQGRVGKGAEKAAATPPPQDNVHLSSQGKVQTLAGPTAGSGVFDANKVDEIKAAIASGKFQVDAEKVADGLLDTVHDLIHSRKG